MVQILEGNIILINDVLVTFHKKNRRVLISSRDVANVFEKAHENILTEIDSLPDDEFKKVNFKPSTYINQIEEVLPEYYLTKDGFNMVAASYVEAKACEYKQTFIRAFYHVENTSKQRRKNSKK